MPADPKRTCLGCRERASAQTLVRIAAVGEVAIVDDARRLPGRGAWLHPGPTCVQTALVRKAISRALRQSSLDTSEVLAHQVFT